MAVLPRDKLRLASARLQEGINACSLSAMPCEVCGVAGPAPEVILCGGGRLQAFCIIEHARQRGWPWLVHPASGGSPTTKE